MALGASETAQLGQDHARIEAFLREHGLQAEPYPLVILGGRAEGAAAARAYPIQGILKYHGLVDWQLRTAYLPSISVNNDAAYSLTLVQFDAGLTDDQVAINGAPADDRARARVVQTLDTVRALARIGTRASVVSRNVTRAYARGQGAGNQRLRLCSAGHGGHLGDAWPRAGAEPALSELHVALAGRFGLP